MSGWIDDIKDMIEKEKQASAIPWGFAKSTPAQNAQPGIIFYTSAGIPQQPPKPDIPLIHPNSTDVVTDAWEQDDEPPKETIFEFEGWTIDRYTDAVPSDVDWVSHYCPDYGWRYNTDMWGLMADGVCGHCCEAVPEEVLAVWKLKNFDYIPTEDAAIAVLSPGEDLSC